MGKNNTSPREGKRRGTPAESFAGPKPAFSPGTTAHQAAVLASQATETDRRVRRILGAVKRLDVDLTAFLNEDHGLACGCAFCAPYPPNSRNVRNFAAVTLYTVAEHAAALLRSSLYDPPKRKRKGGAA